MGEIRRIYEQHYRETWLKIQRERQAELEQREAQLDMMQVLYEAKKRQAELEELRYRPDQKRIKGKFAYEGKKSLTKSGKGDKISSSEFVKSLRGVGKRYPIRGNGNGKHYGNHFQLDTSHDIEKVRVFAGKGTEKAIRNAIFIGNDYHVPAEELQKCSGFGYVIVDGKSVRAELHWYQANGIRIDPKIKPPSKKRT